MGPATTGKPAIHPVILGPNRYPADVANATRAGARSSFKKRSVIKARSQSYLRGLAVGTVSAFTAVSDPAGVRTGFGGFFDERFGGAAFAEPGSGVLAAAVTKSTSSAVPKRVRHAMAPASSLQ